MGRPEGAELFTVLNTGAANVTLRSVPWGRPRGRLGTLRLGKQREYAFCPCQRLYRTLSGIHSFFQKKKNQGFCRTPWKHPQVTLQRSCLAPADLRRSSMMFFVQSPTRSISRVQHCQCRSNEIFVTVVRRHGTITIQMFSISSRASISFRDQQQTSLLQRRQGSTSFFQNRSTHRSRASIGSDRLESTMMKWESTISSKHHVLLKPLRRHQPLCKPQGGSWIRSQFKNWSEYREECHPLRPLQKWDWGHPLCQWVQGKHSACVIAIRGPKSAIKGLHSRTLGENPNLVSDHGPVSSVRFSFRTHVAARVSRIRECVTSLDQLFIARHHLKYASQANWSGDVTHQDISSASGIIARQQFKNQSRPLWAGVHAIIHNWKDVYQPMEGKPHGRWWGFHGHRLRFPKFIIQEDSGHGQERQGHDQVSMQLTSSAILVWSQSNTSNSNGWSSAESASAQQGNGQRCSCQAPHCRVKVQVRLRHCKFKTVMLMMMKEALILKGAYQMQSPHLPALAQEKEASAQEESQSHHSSTLVVIVSCASSSNARAIQITEITFRLRLGSFAFPGHCCQSFWPNNVFGRFPLCPQCPPPHQKRVFHFYCRLAVSDSWELFGKSKGGLSKWGLKVPVHNCPRLPAIVVILRPKFPLERGPKGPQKCTIVDDCAKITDSGLKPPFIGTYRRRTNVQQLTCNINLSSSFYYLFFSFVLIGIKPFVLKGKALGEKFWKSVKKCEQVRRSVKIYETILTFSCCPLVFPWI